MSLPSMAELYNIGQSFFYNGSIPVVSPLLHTTDDLPPQFPPTPNTYLRIKEYNNFKEKIEGRNFSPQHQKIEYNNFKTEIEGKSFRQENDKENDSIFDNMFDGKIEERIIKNKYSKTKAKEYKPFKLGNINGSSLMKRRNMFI